jgi:archaeal flagellar protein FlaI
VNRLAFELKLCDKDCGKECGENPDACPAYNDITAKGLKEKCQANPHLLQYLYSLRRAKLPLPEYHDKLNRSMKSMRSPSVLYPVSANIFVHVLTNSEDIRNHYIAVEPSLMDTQNTFVDEIENHLTDYVDELEGIPETAKRVDIILDIVDRLVVVRGGNGKNPAKKRNGGITMPFSNGKKKAKHVLTLLQYKSLRYLIRRKLEGLGVLQPMIDDPHIEDISCSGLGNIFVEHKIFSGCTTTIGFNDHDELDKFVIQLAERIKRPVTFRDPCVDSTLPDGSRINIVYGIDVSKRGSNFTIRKFSQVPMSVIELIQQGTLNFEMAAYLSVVLQEHMNIFVAGETASGKTTLINAITTFVPPENKIVSIEDTPEIQVPHPNWIRGCTRGAAKNSETSQVSMFDLLKASLRQRPNLIIIGEIRGEEGAIAFQAMQTGHACMSTFHAASVTKLLQRLSGNPISVPKSYLDNLNVVIITSMVQLPNGQAARRVISINEIVSYDSVSDSFSFIEVFTWNPINDSFEFKGFMNSYLLESKIAPKRGITFQNRRQIYDMIKKRAEVLKRISDQKITNFYDLHAVLTKAYREGYFR